MSGPGAVQLFILETLSWISATVMVTGPCSGRLLWSALRSTSHCALPLWVASFSHMLFQYYYPNVTLWDLPGIGTPMFPAEKYLKHVEFRMFYFFIIVSETHITENDVKLALKIQEMGKKFYFVRSKIDKDLGAERRKRNFSKERTLTKIREDCAQGECISVLVVFNTTVTW
uniref:IRG-type G domain-containing protein n=1 Tax=Maylandia zebra TaxID=106582 RepID=A0A3P9DR07_9CICH